MQKRAQAAMEFLMTYGWAILVVLAAIGALAYFGVLSPDRFLPEKCTLPSGVACLDFTASSTQVVMRIQNSGGFDMTGVNVRLSNATDTVLCTPSATTLSDGQQQTFTCTSNFAAGKLKSVINMTYTNQQTSMSHVKSGELIAKIG
ncbi:MAG: hypothetical protein V1837_06630 [Candidatus Woesearchaeota archaeon]